MSETRRSGSWRTWAGTTIAPLAFLGAFVSGASGAVSESVLDLVDEMDRRAGQIADVEKQATTTKKKRAAPVREGARHRSPFIYEYSGMSTPA